ncbi:TetR/AcrR family transcriptional regulator [Nocardioides bruguierae]|uniref:TetR/AcrR family transcriptional regulator n=1 Tax=Nocardioides bruguierae TaxID=2945102 RepID=A0A9X2D869_9ACTN|nr:TetR/AcrR family transcriptional regulator [Nocardioides bruguierae]MCL8025281.1 TetR/AcrR family transcriptional regulator [Nocardioides bruguierae]MCM0621093.1 TetR/AcrR family transcriptional regulator [Nocardioides bruguierae]
MGEQQAEEKPRRRGRPRKASSVSGLGTEEDILVSAAKQFSEVGFGSTSTYAIAQGAGISQATMYHHFGGKHAILLALLLRTVEPSVAYADGLAGAEGTAAARLWALCAYDARLLASGETNLGSLYLLPELGDERFASFHAQRDRLAGVYAGLVAALVAEQGVAEGAGELADLVFGLVESVILRRRDAGVAPGREVTDRIADAALRVVGLDADAVAAAREAGAALVP